jgi:hypothetical protein
MAYNIYLNDWAISDDKYWNDKMRGKIGNYLRELFNEVCLLDECPYYNAEFTWDYSAASYIRPGEILIYFVESHAESLIRLASPHAKLHSNGGSTALNMPGGVLSEVYVNSDWKNDNNPARGYALTAFHEAMHNKLEYPGTNAGFVHSQGGAGLAAPYFYHSGYQLSQRNKELMAPALPRRVPQNKAFIYGF